MTDLPQFPDIEAAAARLATYAAVTPVLEHPALNARMGRRVLLKLETMQRTGSFKFRGACNRLLAIPEGERASGVVAFSSGNHAQGVAAAAAELGLAATIVMPADAPAAKIAGTKSYGAEIVYYDRLKDDREAIAAKICAEKGATLVRPFDDPLIVAGQGTAGLEFARQAAGMDAELETVLVPCSGGGVASGVALAFSGVSPTTRVHPVEVERFDGMTRSLAAGERVRAPGGAPSIADALMAPIPGEVPFALARTCLAPGIVVTDADLTCAVCYAAQCLKLVVEPGGAAGLAALLAGQITGDGPVGILLSGGNCDPETLAACCTKAPNP
jgi:threonine dehydratase